MHIRRHLLEAVRTQLKTLGFAGVWIQRVAPTRNMFPGITLYAEEESVQTETGDYPVASRPQTRVITVAINAWIKSAGDPEKVEADMDAAAIKIEAGLLNTFDAVDVVLVGTDFKVAEDEPEINIVTLTYHLTYYSTEHSATL